MPKTGLIQREFDKNQSAKEKAEGYAQSIEF